MPFSDYIPDNIVTRGVARPLAAVADYYMASRQPAPASAPALSPEELADPNMGYPLTPQQEAMYAYASPKRVVQLTPEELAQYNIPNAPIAAPQQAQQLTPQEMAKYNLANAPVDTSYIGSGGDFGPEQAVIPPTAQPAAEARPPAPQEMAQPEQAPVYPEQEHRRMAEIARAKISKATQAAMIMMQQNRGAADAIKFSLEKSIDANINKEYLKPFSDLPEGKAAFERVKELNTAASKSAKLLSNQLKTFDNYMAAGDSEGARQYAVQSITRTLQSLTGQDAEQMSEFLRRSEALLSVPEILRQTNSNSWTKDSIGILLSRLQKGDAELIAANPERWAQFAKSAVNDYAKTYNEALQNDVINKTSPEFAKRIPGSDFMKTFDVPMNFSAPTQQPKDKIALAQKALSDPNASAAHKAAARKILGK